MSTITAHLDGDPGTAGGTGLARLHFAAGIPGFPQAKTFAARPWGPQPSPFVVLECEELQGLHFVAVPPAVFFAGYEPTFGPEVLQAVDAGGPEDLLVLVILTLRSRPEDTTANLLGPLVANSKTGQALQAVLSGSGWSPQARIVQDR